MRYEPKHARSATPKSMGNKNRHAGRGTAVPKMRRSVEGASGIWHEEATGASSPGTRRGRSLMGLIPVQRVPSLFS